MDKVKVQELLDKMTKYVPISKIEADLKMPKNTLQKALSETEKRGLPKRWERIFTEFVNYKQYLNLGKIKIQDATKQPNTVNGLSEPNPESNYSINTTDKRDGAFMNDAIKKKLGIK